MKLTRHWADWLIIIGGAGLALSFALPALGQTPTPTDTTATPAPAVAPAPATPAPSPVPVPAPAVDPSLTRAPSLAGTLAPARPTLVALRSDADVRADMDRARNTLVAADAAMRTAKSRSIEAKTNSEIKKRDIGAIEVRLKAAKQLKADADKADLERARKTENQRRDVFDRLQETWDAEADLAKAQTDWANALMKSCEVELEVVSKAAMASSNTDAALFGAEQRLLEARKLTAAKAEGIAEREQSVADKKLRVYQAWSTLTTGK